MTINKLKQQYLSFVSEKELEDLNKIVKKRLQMQRYNLTEYLKNRLRNEYVKEIIEDEDGEYLRYDDVISFVEEIYKCWLGTLPIIDMSAQDLIESIENVVQQRLPGFDAYASTPK